MTRARGKDGQYKHTEDPVHDTKLRREEAQKIHGYTIKDSFDYLEEQRYLMEKYRLAPSNEKVDDLGFTQDFYKFLGFRSARNYLHDAPQSMLSHLKEDTANYFTPVDDFYGTGQGGDTVYDYGRIPVSHLMKLCSQRLGIAFRACHGIAMDVFCNKFEFVEIDNPDKAIKKREIEKWMRPSKFWDHMVNILDFNHRTGLGYLVGRYKNDNVDKWYLKAPNTRPNGFDSWSAYYLTPTKLHELDPTSLDYEKQRWNFIGGIQRAVGVHHSRVYVLETDRVEGGLRGLALPELCWTPLMCYLNTMYYILKSLSTMGTLMASITTESAYPTEPEFQAYLDLWNEMVANKLFMMGKGATFSLLNTAGKIGQGIESYLEFLREDISAAWIFPKNQLFGRAEGGGLEGAGALVSKEDYLSSNISAKQLNLTNDVRDILMDMCVFPDLENYTLRWNLDLHKTLEQRLKEQLMQEQVEQTKVQTKDIKLMHKLNKAQIGLQIEMAEIQEKMMKKNPEQFLQTTKKDEENIEEKPSIKKEVKKDFIEYQFLKQRYDILENQYKENWRILNSLQFSKSIKGYN